MFLLFKNYFKTQLLICIVVDGWHGGGAAVSLDTSQLQHFWLDSRLGLMSMWVLHVLFMSAGFPLCSLFFSFVQFPKNKLIPEPVTLNCHYVEHWNQLAFHQGCIHTYSREMFQIHNDPDQKKAISEDERLNKLL